jgi:hypothetical protein
MNDLLYGIITGIIFGFLLQKARVIRYDKQLAALRLMDMTIVKYMFTTVLVAMVGVYLLKDLGLVKLSIKPTVLGGNIIGGLIFGRWALWGTAPEHPSVPSEGRYDSWGIVGMRQGRRHLPKSSPHEENGPDLGKPRQDHHPGNPGCQSLDSNCNNDNTGHPDVPVL